MKPTSRGEPTYRPRPRAYAAFASAVARHYGDRVDRYILRNEPNIATWLQPQAKCSRGPCTPVAPHLYRGLVRAAYVSVRAPTGRAGADRDAIAARR